MKKKDHVILDKSLTQLDKLMIKFLLKIPCKSKKYVMKWLEKSPVWNYCIIGKDQCGKIKINFSMFKHGEGIYPFASFVVCGKSLRDMFNDSLGKIAYLENMSNLHELLIWLDL